MTRRLAVALFSAHVLLAAPAIAHGQESSWASSVRPPAAEQPQQITDTSIPSAPTGQPVPLTRVDQPVVTDTAPPSPLWTAARTAAARLESWLRLAATESWS